MSVTLVDAKCFTNLHNCGNTTLPSTAFSSFRYDYIATSPSLTIFGNLQKVPIMILTFPQHEQNDHQFSHSTRPTKLLRPQFIHQLLHHVQHPNHALEIHDHQTKYPLLHSTRRHPLFPTPELNSNYFDST